MKRIYLILTLIFFIADRIIKQLSPSIDFEGGFIKFGLYKNYAGAFSLPLAGSLYNFIGILVFLAFLYFFMREFAKKEADNIILFSYLLVILGGASNLFDRFAYGYVIDYIGFFRISFLNLADVMIGGGVLVLIIKKFR